MKIRLMEAEFFHADGRMDEATDGRTNLTKQTVVFRNFTIAHINTFL